MNSLQDYLQQDFKTQYETWEELLKTELKIQDVSPITSKKTHEGPWPTLGLEALTHLLPVTEIWKKASQTYIQTPSAATLAEDLDQGVRLFFFGDKSLTAQVISQLESHPKREEVVLVAPGENELTSSKIKLITQVVSGRDVHHQGGSNVQELGLLALNLVESLSSAQELQVGIYLDSAIFKNIAKIRAAKLITQKILEESALQKTVLYLGLTSYREWTLYERYSNMLRNSASVASGYLGGADFVQSSGYLSAHYLEIASFASEEEERSLRMSRNTSHILALESMLGVVEDPAFGSYHLEALTEEYARRGWEYMQKLLAFPANQRAGVIAEDARLVREKRDALLETRKQIIAGMNEYPDAKEVLNLSHPPKKSFYRVAQRFEDLRLSMERASKRPQVYLAIYGSYAALNARVNFARNTFELLGLEVVEGEALSGADSFRKQLAQRSEEIIVVCSSDEGYGELGELSAPSVERFVAGKVKVPGFENIFAGQNVLEILSRLVSKWGQA